MNHGHRKRSGSDVHHDAEGPWASDGNTFSQETVPGFNLAGLRLFIPLATVVLGGIPFVEPLHPARRIYDLLLARHEGMTLRTYFDFNILLG
jgi:hypothetical protein